MAQDDKQQEGSSPRVRKANEVHKRRVERKPRSQAHAAASAVPGAEDVEDAASEVAASMAGATDAGADDARVQAAFEQGESSAAPRESDEPGEWGESDGESEGAEGVEPDGEGVKPDRPSRPSVAAPDKPKPRSAATVAKRVALAIVGIALLAAVVAASLFAWNRWGRFDDHADMMGDWYVDGTAALVTIDEDSINLADNLAYVYEIDDHEKTIRYTFGSWQGQGRYWFSDDRSYLVITDGEFTGVGNTVDDLVAAFGELTDAASGKPTSLPQGEGIIVFNRRPDPQAFAEKQRAERQKQLEQDEEADGEGSDDEIGEDSDDELGEGEEVFEDEA